MVFICFLDAPSHLYKRSCPSLRRSVRPSVPCYFRTNMAIFRCAVASLYEVESVRPSVRPSVRRSVCPVLFSMVKCTHTRRILCGVSGLVFQLFLGFLNLCVIIGFFFLRSMFSFSTEQPFFSSFLFSDVRFFLSRLSSPFNHISIQQSSSVCVFIRFIFFHQILISFLSSCRRFHLIAFPSSFFLPSLYSIFSS